MAFQPVPDTAEFRIVGSAFSGAVEIVNTVYVRDTTAGWTGTKVNTIAVAVGDIWRDEMCPLLSSTYVFDKVEGTDIGAEFGAQATAEYNTTGGVVGTPLSAALCMFGKFNGEGGSAPRRGGLFVSPFSEALIAGDTWDAVHAGLVQVALQDLRDGINSLLGAFEFVIVSRYSKSAVPVFPHKRTEAVTNLVGSIEVSQRLAMQRDRRTGEGS